jgi:hypothetical protein
VHVGGADAEARRESETLKDGRYCLRLRFCVSDPQQPLALLSFPIEDNENEHTLQSPFSPVPLGGPEHDARRARRRALDREKQGRRRKMIRLSRTDSAASNPLLRSTTCWWTW